MERNKLLGWVLGTILLLALGAWLLGRAGNDEPGNEGERSSAGTTEDSTPSTQAVRRASERPDLATEAKATISGTVEDSGGKPIAGAQVCAWASTGDLEGLPAGKPRCTKSESDGHYRLDGLFPVRMVVNAEARGYLPQRWAARHETYREELLQLHAGQTRDDVDFTLRAGGFEVEGVVRDISGGVIEGAFVWVGSNGFNEWGRSAGVSDGEGKFSLWAAPGRIIVHADADGYAPGTRMSGAPGQTLEVLLTPESVITGRVVMAGTGEPVSGVVVRAEGERFFSEGQGQARSDDAGKFRINKLAPGIYTVGARGDELYGEAVELVHLGLAQTADDVVVELHPAFVVSGQLTLAGGTEPRPCPQGSIGLKDRTDKRNSRFGRATADGEVEIRSVLPGTYEVEVRCDGMVPELEYADIEVTDANVSGQVWEVREGLAIRGEVVDGQGRPVEGVKVFAGMKVDPDSPRKQMTRGISDPTLEDGQFTIAGLLPGSYEVRLFATERPETEALDVELESGADINDIHIQVPSDGNIAGVIRDADGQPVAGVALRANALAQRSSAIGVSDDDGRFVIEHLAVGDVRIFAMQGMATLRAPGTSDDDEQGTLARVEANETTEVEIVVESQKATIRGRVLDEHGSPVADAFVSHQRESDSAAAAQGAAKRSLRWRFEDRPVLTDHDGNFVIEGLADNATYTIAASRRGGGEAVQDGVSVGASVELTIVDTGEIAGKVVTGEGEAAPERFKLTLHNDAEALTRTDELFRSGGAFRMKELPPGTYTLIADSSVGVARVEGIELAGGEIKDDLVVTLTPRVTVRGRLLDIDSKAPIPGLSVSVTARGTTVSFGQDKGGDAPHISDADGRFEVADALTGKVTLSVVPRSFVGENRYSWLMMSYEIPAGDGVVDIGDVELVADRVTRGDKPGDSGFEIKDSAPDAQPEDFVATVAVVRPGGPADKSGLEVGDQIETVNGHDVRGTNAYRLNRLTKVAPGVSFELGLAGGGTVKITAGPAIH